MSRFFTENLGSPTVTLAGEDVRHMVTVLRLRPGDTVTLVDGQGLECEAEILSVSAGTATLQCGPLRACKSEPKHRVTLFQCLPKAGKLETVLQKGTELGLFALCPVVSERCVVLPGKEFEKKRIRYQKVAEEAAKQSRRGIIPEVLPLQILKHLDFSGYDTVLLAYEEETEMTLKKALAEAGEKIALIIGPEGGFSQEEAELLKSKGAVSISLGPRILRTETAGPAALAEILFFLEG